LLVVAQGKEVDYFFFLAVFFLLPFLAVFFFAAFFAFFLATVNPPYRAKGVTALPLAPGSSIGQSKVT
jgi:hypothetical protein